MKPLIAFIALLVSSVPLFSQTNQPAEEFTAIAVVNNNLASGLNTVTIRINRWSPEAERTRLVTALLEKGPDTLLHELEKNRPVGTIRTPDSLAYDLRYAHQTPTENGGRRIVIATDRPIGFWEATYRPRTVDYPFTVIQMEIGPEGKGHGTMSYATKIRAHDNIIELEHFATSPIMLNEIKSRPVN